MLIVLYFISFFKEFLPQEQNFHLVLILFPIPVVGGSEWAAVWHFLGNGLNHNHSVFECWSTVLHSLQDSSKCPNKTSSKTISAYSEILSKLPDLLCKCTNWIDGDNSNREEKPGSNENNWWNACNFSKNLGIFLLFGLYDF